MIIHAALIGARLAHFVAMLSLFGVACFPSHGIRGPAPDGFSAWRKSMLGGSAIAALSSGCAWFVLTAADMNGDAASALDPAILSTLVIDTDFGKLWILRMTGCVFLAVMALAPRARPRRDLAGPLFTGLSALVLASLAVTGHGAMPGGWIGELHATADAIHLLAAGVWIGALWALGWLVSRRPDCPQTAKALRRFSTVGQLAVGVLIVTGLANSAALVGEPSRLLTTTYGLLLLGKLAAFGAMVVLAGLNRFWLVPRMTLGSAGVVAMRLKHHVLAEQGLAMAVIGIVAGLGTLDPTAAAATFGR